MTKISITYDLKWQHKEHPHYKWSTCGKLFNTKTNRTIKKTVNGRSVGYWVAGNFLTLNTLREQIVRIPKEKYPF